MKYLIFSDIHSNLEGLRAVLSDSKKHGYDTVICLGDFVGYGANPNECIQEASALKNFSAVLGNHDAAVINPAERELFNPVARAGVVFSEENLDEDSANFLRNLPMVIDGSPDFLAVHASPHKPEAWIYVMETFEAADAFRVMGQSTAFVGHTHFPAVHWDDATIKPFQPGEPVTINGDRKCIVNVGSVGQPRDGDPRAAYAIYDDEKKAIEIFRVEYDIDTAAEKILKAGLPPMLADRLRRGY